MLYTDDYWMNLALEQAQKAEDNGEVPVGAVIVKNNAIISVGQNSVINLNDPTAHAEIVAIRDAGKKLQNYRMVNTGLYVTLEPCIMCMGAIIQARIERLVFGAADPKSGAAGSVYSIGEDNLLNHSLEVERGIMQEKCSIILKEFFKKRRKN